MDLLILVDHAAFGNNAAAENMGLTFPVSPERDCGEICSGDFLWVHVLKQSQLLHVTHLHHPVANRTRRSGGVPTGAGSSIRALFPLGGAIEREAVTSSSDQNCAPLLLLQASPALAAPAQSRQSSMFSCGWEALSQEQ